MTGINLMFTKPFVFTLLYITRFPILVADGMGVMKNWWKFLFEGDYKFFPAMKGF